jgi:SAM-dependent methyltransferase
MNLKSLVPWHARVVGKVVLSRVPAGYGVWRRLHLFSHGLMHEPSYAYQVFDHHFRRTRFADERGPFVALELGPGDSVVSAVIAAAHGARRVYLVDAGPFATRDLSVYARMCDFLAAKGASAPDLAGVVNLADVLERCHAQYDTRGLESLRQIPTASVDLSWSQAVLEHIRRDEFAETMRELRRVMRPGGISSHVIDLKDHLGGALNNMRIPSRWWERDWMARSGFYTNRLRMSEMLDVFRGAGFDVQVDEVHRWDAPPTPVKVMASEFRTLPCDDFLVKEFTVTLRCP